MGNQKYTDLIDSKEVVIKSGKVVEGKALALNDNDDFRDVYFYINSSTFKKIFSLCGGIIKKYVGDMFAKDGTLSFRINASQTELYVGKCDKENNFNFIAMETLPLKGSADFPITMRKGYLYCIKGLMPWMFQMPFEELEGTVKVETYLCYMFDMKTGLKKLPYNVIYLEV